MDRKKQRAFRNAYPKEYQMDVESLVTSTRSASYANNANRTAALRSLIVDDKRSERS